jgi:predicted ferric reductase
MTLPARGAFWLALYFHLIVLPLIFGVIWPGDGGGRPFLTQFAAACGYAALVIMVLEFALISKIQSVASAFGQDALLHFHRRMGIVAALLLVIHGYGMLQAGYPLEWLNPIGEDIPWAMRWGTIAAVALLLLILFSLFRRQIRLAYEWWQISHGLLADATILTSLAHILLFGGFSSSAPMRGLLGGYTALFLALRVWFNLVQPYRQWSRPWEVVENRKEFGRSRTLVLRPVGHQGFTFEPGQFAWLCTGKTPFHKDRHPISMSSTAYDEPGRDIAFTIKDLGDWSGRVVPSLPVGHRVWVDGPYGVFTADREQGSGYVLIGGGAGIAPLYSICQTLAERGDPRPVVLFYGGHDPLSLAFREQLDALQQRMNLRCIYTLEAPPADWAGESGYVTAEMLRKHLPAQYKRFQYFLCGPDPMVEAMEHILPSIGVPAERIQTERFIMV